jgi:hypothetical protein
MYYIDNIRIYLTILVILHHLAIAYEGSDLWPLTEPPTDSISPIIFLLFNAINQSYFMSFFFILAGYFTPLSLEKKGPTNFMKGRLIRLRARATYSGFLVEAIWLQEILSIGSSGSLESDPGKRPHHIKLGL